MVKRRTGQEMIATLDCPLCPARALPGQTERCPSCGGDLAPLLRVRRLRGAVQARVAVDNSIDGNPVGAPSASPPPLPVSAQDSGPKRGADVQALGRHPAVLVSVVGAAAALAFVLGLVAGEGRVVVPPAPHPPPASEGPPLSLAPAAVVIAAPTPRETIPQALRAALATVPGITVHEEGERLIVVPSEGLFLPGSTVPRPTARPSLEALKRAIATSPSVMVRVEGATDDRPVRPGASLPDNATLALLRAANATTLLGEAVGDRWSVGAAAMAPFPNDTPENRARNRTVVIQLSPSSEQGLP